MKILKDKSITHVPYIKAAGIHCGLRRKERKDLCVIYSEKPCVSAATFTTNKIKAAPLIVNMEHIKNPTTKAIVVNSANANSCTGALGIKNAYTMANTAADYLNILPEEVLVASTGLIGIQLPMDKIVSGIKKACSMLSHDGGHSAARAILTTDTFTKEIAVEVDMDGKKVIIAGMAKGSGMVHPNMATILGFIISDVNISKTMLSNALKSSVSDSYNMISVDGETSTNDMVIALANGAAENELIDSPNENYFKFKEALDFVNKELSKMIARDGEGATKLIEVSLYNARSGEDAKTFAKSIVRSNLIKAAVFGCDANWGRIMCSLGYSGGEFIPEKVSIAFRNNDNTVNIVKNGVELPFNKDLAREILGGDYVNIVVDLNDGTYGATAWGCDLSYDYVKINSAYRSNLTKVP